MLKITKISTAVLIFYILFYTQVWGDKHLILYGSAAVTVLSVAIHCIHAGSLEYGRVPYGIWNNLILVFYAVVTGFFVAVDFMTTLRMSITLLAFATVCIAMCYVSSVEGSFEWILKILIALALTCSFFTLFRGTEWSGYGVTMSAINNPHNLAAVLNLGLFSVTFLPRQKERKFSLISVALVLLFFIVTIRCGSRKYLLASALVVGIWAWAVVIEGWKSGDSNRRTITVFLLIAFIGAAFYIIRNVYLGSDSYQRMQDKMDTGSQSRILFYEKAWEIFLKHPIFGGGLDQFKYLSGTGSYAHSTYAEALADFGFVGCVLYFTPIIATTCRIIGRVLKPDRNYSDYLLLAFCLSQLFIGTMQIFFMEFHLFLVWSILFFYERKPMESTSENLPVQQYAQRWKYIR